MTAAAGNGPPRLPPILLALIVIAIALLLIDITLLIMRISEGRL